MFKIGNYARFVAKYVGYIHRTCTLTYLHSDGIFDEQVYSQMTAQMKLFSFSMFPKAAAQISVTLFLEGEEMRRRRRRARLHGKRKGGLEG